jgi:hypothetical protein
MDVNAPIALIGASYRNRDSAVHDFTAVWAARHDGDFHHTSVAVLTKDCDGHLHVERHNSTAKHLDGGAGSSAPPSWCSPRPRASRSSLRSG